MRVLVTGASGFIGSHVVRTLVAAGHQIAFISRTTQDRLWRLQDISSGVVYIPGNLDDLASIKPTLLAWQPEACVHLAWYTQPGRYLEAEDNLTSLSNAISLVQFLAQAGCRKFIGVGSCAEYDTDRRYLQESSPTRPATLYAAAKLSFYLLGQQMTRSLDMDFVWARIFNLYGPFEDARRVVPAAIQTLWRQENFPATTGQQVRDYLHVEDIALAFCHLVEQKIDGIFNIASNKPVRVRTLLESVGQQMGTPELIRFGELGDREWEPSFICGDNRRLVGLGWVPSYDLVTGIRQTCDWWRKQLQSNIRANL
jgi:UDP-glucuronate decarboxylase